MPDSVSSQNFHFQIIELLQRARNQVARAVNHTMIYTYFEIGRRIMQEEQNGMRRAEYGQEIIEGLSDVLTAEFGRGFSRANLQNMRQFYLTYRIRQTVSSELQKKDESALSAKSKNVISQTPSVKLEEKEQKALESNSGKTIRQTPTGELQKKDEKGIQQTLSVEFKLSWSHYLKLMRMDDEAERKFYEIEAAKNNWSVRELQRQYDSALYTRLALSRDKNKVKELSEKGLQITKPQDVIKDPYILEFLGLPERPHYSEGELEAEIIDKLEHFLLELGSGFTFVARQKRITFDEKHFRIDLVFYNRILNCFVLIDLKIGELQHQDLGQMQTRLPAGRCM